jgi:hypothetical protein
MEKDKEIRSLHSLRVESNSSIKRKFEKAIIQKRVNKRTGFI